ncbi:uncharacterized protein YbjT (DUF2867 family) [Paenarthrobacter nitroguajacolicus]|uniref:SDR family oxidoreductase n=1 Tax=Paenarthrobacter nitroguajacolicus TaxID=211146 RepID=UPI002860F969|nr:NAD(P)H-binding protein [Paenarthrobacter nitroguajacolicus]MDR6987650.1 uncharacterized protein YbjT (DUF2867 family) [Paenarthrobacter nitroguajacolicus]
MTSVCVAGGTGQVGREVVRLAAAAGLKVTALSRHVPPYGSQRRHDGVTYVRGDVTTGEGLAAALEGADVVIDCLEGQFGKAQRKFADGGARLLAAAHRAGVTRAVALSIINCDKSTYSYYVSKADKERKYAASALETVVVRATQFHGLVAMVFAAGAKVRLIPVFKGARFQSISPEDVAGALLDAALEGPGPERHRLRTVGGPEVLTMRQMAESWMAATGSKGRIVQVRLPGAMGAFLRAGNNLVPEQKDGTVTFVSWLEKRRESL